MQSSTESPEVTPNRPGKAVVSIVLPFTLFVASWTWLHRLVGDHAGGYFSEPAYQDIIFVIASAALITFLVNRAWRRHANEQLALHENIERLRLLVDNLPDSYVYQYTQLADGTPKFLYVSAGVERLHAITVQDVLNDAGSLLGQIDHRDIDALRASESVSRQSFTDFSMEIRNQGSDGQQRWMMLCSRPQHGVDGRILWNGVATDVTARKEFEIKHQIIEQRLADIIEFLPDATFVIDESKRIVAWNRACEVLTGVNKDAMMGREDYAEAFFGIKRPILIDMVQDASPELEAEYKYVRRKSGVIVGESIATHLNDGKGAHLQGIAAPLYDAGGHCYGAIEVVRDVTEQRLVEQALRDSEQKYRELVELANSIILRWNAEGIITFVNEFGLRFFGYKAAELHGQHVIGTVVPYTESGGRDLRDLMERICADPGAFEQNVNENMLRNGERVWVSWTNKVVLDANGKVLEILSIGTDITQRRRAEEQIIKLNDELRHYAEELEHRVSERTSELAVARDRAEAADRLKSAFLATMSHELRTPLNSIIGFTGILLQGLAGPLNEEQSKQLGMVRGSARHLLDLINDVLDISKIEAGQLQMAREPFDLSESIAKIVSLIKPLADKKHLELRMRYEAPVKMWNSDQRRIEQILINLLNNAVKFTDQGSVQISVLLHNHTLAIAVTDTGIGIRPADLNVLFRPFQQIDSGLTRKHEGTGLGLAICQRLTELLGGHIEVTSEWGRGSTFTVMLPFSAERAA